EFVLAAEAGVEGAHGIAGFHGELGHGDVLQVTLFEHLEAGPDEGGVGDPAAFLLDGESVRLLDESRYFVHGPASGSGKSCKHTRRGKRINIRIGLAVRLAQSLQYLDKPANQGVRAFETSWSLC